MALTIPAFEARFGKVMHFLELQERVGDEDPNRLLADAYRWFYETGWHHPDAEHGEDWLEYHLVGWDYFDAIFAGHTVLELNAIKRARQRKIFEEEKRQGTRVFGTPASRMSISPQFDALYAQVPKHLQKQVAEKLKSLASSTRHQKNFKKHIRLKNGIPCVNVAHGVDLVAEMESAVGVCFLGFQFSDYRHPAISSNNGWTSKMAFCGLLLSCALLMISLIVVPYDVVLTGHGPHLQVFAGYTPLWSNPDIHKACEWYMDEKLDNAGSAYRNCYSKISIPRVILGSGAALVLVIGAFFMFRLSRK